MREGVNRIGRFLLGLLILGGLMSLTPTIRASEQLGAINLLSVTPRIITPNGDGKNDVAFFNFDQSLSGVPISGDVYDLSGAKVAAMGVFGTDDSKMTWDGKDSDGRVVPSGIYLYQIILGSARLTGTVVVAR